MTLENRLYGGLQTATTRRAPSGQQRVMRRREPEPEPVQERRGQKSARGTQADKSNIRKRTPTYRELMETKGYDKETALRIASDLKESERQSRSPEYGISETREREAAAKSAAEKLKMDRAAAQLEADREYIESRGGAIGVLSEAEASRADRTYTTLKRYEVGDNQYDITAAIRDNAFKPAELVKMGFSRADVSQATEQISMMSLPTVGARASAKANLGLVGTPITTIDPNRVKPVSRGIVPAATRNLLLWYQNSDASYDLQKVIESQRFSVKLLRKMGFTEAQIMAAINAAMKDLSASQRRQINKALGTTPRKTTRPETTQQERIDALAEVMGRVNAKVAQDIVSAQGAARDIARESKRTAVAGPGEDKLWYHLPTGQVVSDAQYRKATNNGMNTKADEYTRETSQVRRGVITAVSSFFPVVRAGLPEVTKDELTTMDYAMTGAGVAAIAASLAVPGATALQAFAGAVYGAHTAKEWNNLSLGGKILGSVASASMLGGAAKSILQPSFKPVKVPLKGGGEAIVWKGFSVRGQPVIGITKVPPRIGAVKKGWRPITKTETSVLGARKMMEKMGISKTQIDSLLKTKALTRDIQPVRSKWEPKKADAGKFAPQSLKPNEFVSVLKRAVKNSKLVDEVYGSTTIKMQLHPKLRNWRKLGDVELQLKVGVTEKQAAKLAADMVQDLNKSRPGWFRIDPKDAKRILVKGGHHAVELKLAEVSKLGVEAQYNLARTGEMSWGLKVAQKPITVNLPGVGKIRIMRLSESGVRKADSITRHQGSGVFGPEPHRIKDIADYYAIIYTLKDPKTANAWAKAAGFDPSDILAQLAKDPPKLQAWSFSPNAAVKGSPSVSIALPPELASIAKSSPGLYKSITTPTPSAALSPSSSQSVAISNSVYSALAASPALTSDAKSPSAIAAGRAEDKPSEEYTTKSPGSASAIKAGRLPSGAAKLPSGSKAIAAGKSTSSPAAKSTDDSRSIAAGKSPGYGITTTGIKSPGGYTTKSPGGSSKGGGGGGGTGTGTTSTTTPYSPGGGGGGGGGGGSDITIKLPDGRKVTLTKREYVGIVGWRQGLFYIMAYPPYGKQHLIYTREPIPGIRYARGPESPQRSAAVVGGGKLPHAFEVAMGVTKVRVQPHATKRFPRLTFTARKAARPRIGEIRK